MPSPKSDGLWPLLMATVNSLRTTSDRITRKLARSAKARARVDLPVPGKPPTSTRQGFRPGASNSPSASSQEPRAFPDAISVVERLESPYDRAYYAGIAWERRAKARHNAAGHSANHYAYDWLINALMLFEKAEALRAPGNDEAVLRWNACVRYLETHKEIAPVAAETPEPILSE